MRSIEIGNLTIGPGHPPVIIAEAGINWRSEDGHDNDIRRACSLITEASKAGAHIVKFQSHIAVDEMLRDGTSAGYIGGSFYDLIEACELSRGDHEILMSHAKNCGIMFMSTPFSREAADMLDALGVPAFKTGSGELTNIPLLRHIAQKGKPMIISTGMSTHGDILETVKAIRPINPNIVLMNCASTSPSQ